MVQRMSCPILYETNMDFLQKKVKEDWYVAVETENEKLRDINLELNSKIRGLNADNLVVRDENRELRKERVHLESLVSQLQRRIHLMSILINNQQSQNQNEDEEGKSIVSQKPIGAERSTKKNLEDQKVQLQKLNDELQAQYEPSIEATSGLEFIVNDSADFFDLSDPNLKNMPNPLTIGSLHHKQTVKEMYGVETEKIEKYKKSWLEIKPVDPVLLEEFTFTAGYSKIINEIRNFASQPPSAYMTILPLLLGFSKLNYNFFKSQKDAGQFGNHIEAAKQLGDSILMCISKIQEIMDDLEMTAEMVTMAEYEKYLNMGAWKSREIQNNLNSDNSG